MHNILTLFQMCDHGVSYETAGNCVNYAFVEEGEELHRTLYIFFQGSSEKTDWIRNFLFRKKPYKDMKIPYRVHRGFLKAWKEVEDIVINKITEKDEFGCYRVNRYQKVVVVGYSHGAALAALCHECVWFNRPDLRDGGLIGCGFEAPRVYGWFCVKKELKERWNTFHVVRTNNDIVTHMPPWIFGYCHVGTLINIHGDTSLINNKLPKCFKSHFPQVVEDALKKQIK